LVQRQSVTTIFVYPVHWGENRLGIQIDLITSFSWKGIPYLDAVSVMRQSVAIPSSCGLLNRPSIYHEAIISLFSSYLVGGWVKERYQQKIQQVFENYHSNIVEELQPLPPKLVDELVNAVIKNDQKLMLSLLKRVRFWIFYKKVQLAPLYTIKNIFTHYFRESKIRFTQHEITSLCFLGADGAGKSTIIKALQNNLRDTVKEMSYVHLKPSLKANTQDNKVVVDDPHNMPTRNNFISTAKLLWWLILYRYDHVLHKHRCSAIRIWDRHYSDVYIDPKRYRYGAPMRIAKFIGTLIPQPDLFFVLDAPAEVIQARKQEVPLAETQRQRNEYLKFAREQPNCIILNTSVGIEQTVKEGTAQILRFMKNKQINRFISK
jgi:thymidylate kinase